MHYGQQQKFRFAKVGRCDGKEIGTRINSIALIYPAVKQEINKIEVLGKIFMNMECRFCTCGLVRDVQKYDFMCWLVVLRKRKLIRCEWNLYEQHQWWSLTRRCCCYAACPWAIFRLFAKFRLLVRCQITKCNNCGG